MIELNLFAARSTNVSHFIF